MRLYEFEGKKLLKEAGLPVGASEILVPGDDIPARAREAAERIGLPVVLKVQILRGGRGKAGGIKVAASALEAGETAGALMDSEFYGMKPACLLMEKALDIDREYYLGITIDEIEKENVLILSEAGGVDVEEAAKRKDARFVRWGINQIEGIFPFQAKEVASKAGFDGKLLNQVTGIITRAWDSYREWDAQLLEINPLAVTKSGDVVAADCRMEIDDEAMFRQKDRLLACGVEPREDRSRPPTRLELEGAEVDKIDHRGVAGRVVEFDGDIGLIIGGGGASLTVFDAILRYGGKPANYCEIGGNPTVKKIKKLTEVIVKKPGIACLGVITNVLSNTRVDLVARGVINGLLDSGVDLEKFPVVFRVPGSWEDDGFRILDKYGIRYFTRHDTMDNAAKYLVEMRNSIKGGGKSKT